MMSALRVTLCREARDVSQAGIGPREVSMVEVSVACLLWSNTNDCAVGNPIPLLETEHVPTRTVNFFSKKMCLEVRQRSSSSYRCWPQFHQSITTAKTFLPTLSLSLSNPKPTHPSSTNTKPPLLAARPGHRPRSSPLTTPSSILFPLPYLSPSPHPFRASPPPSPPSS